MNLKKMKNVIMKTIEERAIEKCPVHLVTRNGMPWTEYDANEKKRNFYIEIATEQRQIDEAECTEEMRKLNEEWKENLDIQRKMLIDKACVWMRVHLPRVIDNYPINGKRVSMLNEDMREDFRKAMEE